MSEEEFEKQTLDNLITDLKDIDKYTSFKNGAFIYDLGKYQGTLLVNYIEQLQDKINRAKEYIKDNIYKNGNEECYSFDGDIFEILEILEGKK